MQERNLLDKTEEMEKRRFYTHFVSGFPLPQLSSPLETLMPPTDSESGRI